MIKMLLSVVVSLVPQRYRRAWFGDYDVDLRRGALISAVLECLGSVAALVVRYPYYIWARQAMLERLAHATTEYEKVNVAYRGVSVLTFVEYLVLPLTMLLLYTAMEGLIRTLGVVVSGEILPTLPLACVDWIHGLVAKRHHEYKLGPRIVDEVVAGTSPEYDLRVDSCRAKPWTNLTTVRYQDELFEVRRQLTGPPPRPWVYMLKRMPAGKIVRGIHNYQPTETLQEEE